MHQSSAASVKRVWMAATMPTANGIFHTWWSIVSLTIFFVYAAGEGREIMTNRPIRSNAPQGRSFCLWLWWSYIPLSDSFFLSLRVIVSWEGNARVQAVHNPRPAVHVVSQFAWTISVDSSPMVISRDDPCIILTIFICLCSRCSKTKEDAPFVREVGDV